MYVDGRLGRLLRIISASPSLWAMHEKYIFSLSKHMPLFEFARFFRRSLDLFQLKFVRWIWCNGSKAYIVIFLRHLVSSAVKHVSDNWIWLLMLIVPRVLLPVIRWRKTAKRKGAPIPAVHCRRSLNEKLHYWYQTFTCQRPRKAKHA